MATYKQIQEYTKRKYNFTPATCHIADAKRRCGIKVRMASNRINKNEIKKSCPEKYLPKMKKTFIHFKIIKK